MVKNSPGLGYVLGDEGSGAYLGKKVIQYYLYDTFDDELKERFNAAYNTSAPEILDAVYKKPLANRYLAQYALFLSQNRGHYMIENILEDGLNDFFFQHLCKYGEVWTDPVHFVGSIAAGFKDVIEQLCQSYEFELGHIFKNPMQGLIRTITGSLNHEQLYKNYQSRTARTTTWRNNPLASCSGRSMQRTKPYQQPWKRPSHRSKNW